MVGKSVKNSINLSRDQERHFEKHLEQHVEKHLSKNLNKQLPKHLSNHLISKNEFLSSQVKHHTTTAIIAAFSFLIALAWKDFLVKIVTALTAPITLEKYPYIADMYSAIIITIIAVLGIVIITKWAKKPEVLVSETKTR